MPINEDHLTRARINWGDGLVKISKSFEADGIDAARKVAEAVIDDVYGYALGDVLFKPTMASGEQTFRPTRKGALSYFVGHDKDYPLDGGFGLMGWRNVTSETAAQYIDDDVALWMGSVSFTNREGIVTIVDKSFGYKRDESGRLKIILHHSSLPFQP